MVLVDDPVSDVVGDCAEEIVVAILADGTAAFPTPSTLQLGLATYGAISTSKPTAQTPVVDSGLGFPPHPPSTPRSRIAIVLQRLLWT
ncbi:hypothetical protein K439DRAFT_1155454 [Ramaria rubella]|nr:hypothetical protein K439DRAFT_1155454 [Ramaria rubella]